MQLMIAVISVLGAAGIIVFTSTLDVGSGVKAVIVTVAVLIAVYSMARIQPKQENPKKDTAN